MCCQDVISEAKIPDKWTCHLIICLDHVLLNILEGPHPLFPLVGGRPTCLYYVFDLVLCASNIFPIAQFH
jgi:hypothetical protein